MSITVKGRSTMALYSSSSCIQCHRVRFVLAEKGINVEIVDVRPEDNVLVVKGQIPGANGGLVMIRKNG